MSQQQTPYPGETRGRYPSMRPSNKAPEFVLLVDLPRFPKSAWEWLPSLQSVADAVLIRAKGESPETLAAVLERVRTLAPAAPVWVNGSWQVARGMGADALHLPADSDASEKLRRYWPGYLTASAHSADEARRHRGADCLIWGHAFATRSKPGLSPRTTLTEVLDAASQPVLAIGGITIATVDSLQGFGLAGVVVADGVWLQANPLQAAEHIKNIVATAHWKERRETKGGEGMQLIVNGESMQVDWVSTVGELLDRFHVSHQAVAVISNGTTVARDAFASFAVQEGDALEIIRFIGGG